MPHMCGLTFRTGHQGKAHGKIHGETFGNPI
jgi:hypothetical protein